MKEQNYIILKIKTLIWIEVFNVFLQEDFVSSGVSSEITSKRHLIKEDTFILNKWSRNGIVKTDVEETRNTPTDIKFILYYARKHEDFFTKGTFFNDTSTSL